MKRIIILILIFAQSFVFGQIYVGAKLGLSPSTIKLKESNLVGGYKWLGYSAGIILEIPFAGGFSIQPEFQYTSNGTRLLLGEDLPRPDFPAGSFYADDGENGGGSDITNNGVAENPQRFTLPDLYEVHDIKVNTLESFLLFKYESINGYYIEIGPYISNAFSGKRTVQLVDKMSKEEASNIILTKQGEPNNKNFTEVLQTYGYKTSYDPYAVTVVGGEEVSELKKFNLGICAGFGIYKDIGDSRIYFDLRYLQGLGNALGRTDIFYGTSGTNSGIQLSLTYLFPLGGE